MRIAKLYMDPQDKSRFEIQGKSSVKYHLKANHVVEAKRWFWALNNAIQWTKDEAKNEEHQKRRKEDMLRQAKQGKPPQIIEPSRSSLDGKLNGKGLIPATAVGVPLTATTSRASYQESFLGGSVAGDDEGSVYDSNEPSIAGNDMAQSMRGTAAIAGDVDDEEEYGDDASSREVRPAGKDAFNITAHSASLQLNLLSQVSSALLVESSKDDAIRISDPTVIQALSTYESAVASLQGLVDNLLKISRDRDAYWQYRLDREADVRKLWEDSMAKVTREQEELEGRMEESETKRKRTKRALKDALEGAPESVAASPAPSRGMSQDEGQLSEALSQVQLGRKGTAVSRRNTLRDPRRKSTIADLTNLSDSDSDENDEFFDAVDSGEIEVVGMPQSLPSSPQAIATKDAKPSVDLREQKKLTINDSFHGYEDPIRKRLKMDADDRPKISLWVSTSS